MAGISAPAFGRPRLHREGRAIVVTFRGLRWTIDPERFAGNPQASGRQDAETIGVRLAVARLPGTDLAFSFVARIFERRGEWRVRLRLPSLGLTADVPLWSWMRGEARLNGSFSGAIALGPDCRVVAQAATINAAADFSFELRDRHSSLNFTGAGRGNASRLSLRPSAPSDERLRGVEGLQHRHATYFALENPVWTHSPNLVCGSRRALARYDCSHPTALSGELAETTRGRRAAFLLLDGDGRLSVGNGSRGSMPARLSLERASALSVRVGRRRRLLLGGSLPEQSYADTSFGLVGISPDPAHPFFSEFGSGDQAGFRARANLQSVSLTLSGGGQAVIEADRAPLEIIGEAGAEPAPSEPDSFGDDDASVAEAAGDDGPAGEMNWMQVGPQPFLLLRLDNTRLRLSRGADLFDLVFELNGYSLRVNSSGEAYLRRRRPPNLTAPWPEAGLTVHFAPQHIGETITDVQGLDCNLQIRPTPVRSRQYGPSRIVFDLGRGETSDLKWRDRPFTIEALTDWSNLDMVVQRRARHELGVSLDAQLQVPAIERDTTLESAFEKIANTLLPPADGETALELTGRLIFSPSEVGRWKTPRNEPGQSTLIWNARLDSVGRSTVRAIWSQWLTPRQFGHCFMSTRPPHGDPWDQELLALTPNDHWDIVGQTSLYGLPALRRIVPESDATTATEAFAKIPRATVVRPEVPDGLRQFRYLTRIDECQYGGDEESGIALAAPFNDADITLTPLGGIFVADWQGDPPLLLPSEGAWNCSIVDRLRARGNPRPARLRGFELERLSIETWLGRDVRIESYLKGYLLPLGIRASFVEIAERRFLKHPDAQYPVAYEVRRTFILIQRPEKHYPAVNQPNAGNSMPAKRVEMLTRVTPDLLSPRRGTAQQKKQAGRVLETDLASGALVFWPRVAPDTSNPGEVPSRGDVEFKFACDGDVTPAVGNMLFVSNAALGSQSDLKLIADHYRAAYEGRRRFSHSGAKRRYAQTGREGETEFDTDNWLMTLTGRTLPTQSGGALESFLMDGRMEGADQPPFYPELETAHIVVQSVDRLLGRSQGLFRVKYNDTYRVTGFSGANPGEIFLEVLDPPVLINFGGQGDAVGGLTKPNTYLAALSRKSGLVGGALRNQASPTLLLAAPASADAGFSRAVLQSPPPSPGQATRLALTGTQSAFSYEEAKKGDFSPTEFFGKGAKLLGVIDLAEVIKAVIGELGEAPRLVEKLAFGALGEATEAETLARVRAAAQGLWPRVRSAIEAVDSAISEITLPPPPNGTVFFPDLYPDLAADFGRARTALVGSSQGPIGEGEGSKLRAIADADSLADVVAAATDLVAALRPLPASIARVAKDPIPPLVQRELDLIAARWKDVQNLLGGEYQQLWRVLRDTINATLHQFCGQIDQAQLGAVLLGLDANVSCAEFLANPRDAATQTAQALFESHLASPMVRLLAMVRDLEAGATAKIDFARRRFEVEFARIIDAAVLAIFDKLESSAPILDEQERAQLASAAIMDAKAQIDSALAGGGEPRDILRRLEIAIRGLDSVVRVHVDTWRRAIIAKAGEDAEQVYEQFRRDTLLPLTNTLITTLQAELERVRALVEAQLARAAEQIADHLIALADALLDSLINSSAFARIAEAGAQLDQWCQTAGTALNDVADAANALGNRTAGPQDAIENALATVTTVCSSAPFPTTFPAVERTRRRLLELAQATSGLVLDLRQARDELARLAANNPTDLCTRPHQFLDPVSRLLEIRIQCARKVPEILAQLSALLDAMQGTPMSPADIARVSRVVTAQARILLTHLTSLAVVTAAGPGWTEAKATIAALIRQLGAQAADYRNALAQAVAEIEREAGRLEGLVSSAAGPVALQAVADEVIGYARSRDKELAALVLQSAAMPIAAAQHLVGGAERFLRKLGEQFWTLENAALTGLDALLDLLDNDVVRLLINPDIFQQLQLARTKLGREVAKLAGLKDGVPDTVSAAIAVRDQWRSDKPPALVDVVTEIITVVRNLLNGNLGAVFNINLRPALQALEEHIREILSQLVPTGLTMDYSFSAALRAVPPLFKMTGAEQKSNLVLTSTIEANFLTGQRRVEVKGEIEPFTLNLVGPLDMATIFFEKATFTSLNGAEPKFDIRVKDVKLGQLLEFLQPLQAWLAPSSDSGFYIKPILNGPLGIEAGYIYDAGVIQVGSIQFINVAFGVSARLFFSEHDAEFAFYLSSVQRPFLVAQPPYGGGGYIKLTANAKRITGMELSFAMGAVTAIRFGPLNAQGRVVAGFSLRQYGDAKELIAFVEAVGEGNIACFSICVSLRVEMRRVTSGSSSRMYGQAHYTFKFKIGRFLEYRYGVTAQYNVQGGQKQATANALSGTIRQLRGECNPPAIESCGGPTPGGARYVNRVPSKATQWRDYRQHLSTNLL